MPTPSPSPHLTLPKHWTRLVQATIIHVMSLAHYVLVSAQSAAASSNDDQVCQAANDDRRDQEIALLREEIRIKDARMQRISAAERPHYLPTERLVILELRAARGWSLTQTANTFLVTAATIASWTKRLDEDGAAALLRTREPVNKFPEFVRYIVQRLQTLCPRLGKVKIAQVLARVGLHLGVTTIGRIRRERPTPEPSHSVTTMPAARRVSAKYPNHVWHVDLTTVPTSSGFWTSWLPFALPQWWPFCWWLAVVMDHYSRRVVGFTVFKRQPTSEKVRQFLGQVLAKVGEAPKYLVSDHGKQFACVAFKEWGRRHAIRQRLGAVGKPGSIAVVERFIRTLKEEGLAVLAVVPLLRRSLHREVSLFMGWYNSERPHMTLSGATPEEVYFGRRPACRSPRFEPRPRWPRDSPCALPETLVKGQPGVQLELAVEFVSGRRHLPRVNVNRAA